MINRKHLKAVLFAGFLGVMTWLLPFLPWLLPVGIKWTTSGFIMTAAAISAKDGWEPPMGAYYYMDRPQGR